MTSQHGLLQAQTPNTSRNLRSHQQTPSLTCSQNCGMPSWESNTPRMMPTSKLYDDWKTRFNFLTHRLLKWLNKTNFQGWSNKSNLPIKFQRSMILRPDWLSRHPRSPSLSGKSLSHHPSPFSNRPSILMSPLQRESKHDFSNPKQWSTNPLPIK